MVSLPRSSSDFWGADAPCRMTVLTRIDRCSIEAGINPAGGGRRHGGGERGMAAGADAGEGTGDSSDGTLAVEPTDANGVSEAEQDTSFASCKASTIPR